MTTRRHRGAVNPFWLVASLVHLSAAVILFYRFDGQTAERLMLAVERGVF